MITLSKDWYINAKNALLSDMSIDGVEIYTYNSGKGVISAMAFVGRSQKPAWMYYFLSMEDYINRAKKTIDSYISKIEAKAQKREIDKIKKIEAIKSIKIGDIFVERFSYEYTTISFHQVVAIKGQKITLQPICKDLVEIDSSGRNEEWVPLKDCFTNEEPKTYSVRPKCGESVYLSTGDSYWHSISSWGGNPEYQTNASWR